MFSALVVSRVNYAIEAWGGFLSKLAIGKINKMFKKARRWGLCTKNYNFDEIQDKACDRLFFKARNFRNHCLSHLLPPVREIPYNLRTRSHNLEIPLVMSELHKKSFFPQCLAKNSY
jgi:hypothetical protein